MRVARMKRAGCLWITGTFAALYILALMVLAIGTFGLFGQDKDPLSAVFLISLGLPWTLWTDTAPEPLLPWVAILAPALNLGILFALCKVRGAGRGTGS